MKKTTQFKNIIKDTSKTTMIPLGALPIHAQMVEKAGFEAFEVSGALVAWWLHGMPDVGMVTRTEVLEAARRIVRAVDIPVYCDADTGYFGIQNVRKTVQDFIYAGVAGIHIEDQVEPKKGGGYAGIEIVSDEEAVGRLRCAVDAKNEIDPDFVIVARTDGYAVAGGGVEEALRRGLLYYKEAGVDAIYYEGVRSWDEAKYLLDNTPCPAYVMASRHAGPAPSMAELSAMKQTIHGLWPVTLPAAQEVWSMLLKIKNSGELTAMEEYVNGMFAREGTEEYIGWGDCFIKPTMQEVRMFEEKYLPAEKQRDYENSTFD